MKKYIAIVSIFVFICIITMPKQNGSYTSKAEGVVNFLVGSFVLYNVASPVLAAIEHTLGKPITYGDCRVKNFIPTGNVVAGIYTTQQGREEAHVRTYTSDFTRFYDMSCPACQPKKIYFVISIENFKAKDSFFYEKSWRSFNAYLYIRTALTILSFRHNLSQPKKF